MLTNRWLCNQLTELHRKCTVLSAGELTKVQANSRAEHQDTHATQFVPCHVYMYYCATSCIHVQLCLQPGCMYMSASSARRSGSKTLHIRVPVHAYKFVRQCNYNIPGAHA